MRTTEPLTEREQQALEHMRKAQELGMTLKAYALKFGLDIQQLQDFAQWTHPISSDWTHLAWATGGAAGDGFYASFLREASFLALTPR